MPVKEQHKKQSISKIVLLMKKLNKSDIKELEKFLSCSVFNKRKDVIRLYSLLRKSYPDFSESVINNLKLYENLYPGKKYTASEMHILVSYLYSAVKMFLTVKEVQNNKGLASVTLLDELTAGNSELFEIEYRSAEKLFPPEIYDAGFE